MCNFAVSTLKQVTMTLKQVTMTIKQAMITAGLLWCASAGVTAQVWQYVDPRIGSVGLGRTFPGPSMPFGMCKPGPDCTVKPNAGWAPMPEVVTGFSQTHVSGTGGGQKYGNILIQPCYGPDTLRAEADFAQRRASEEIALGYYAATFESGIRTEVTTSERCAFYRIHYPQTVTDGNKAQASLLIDATQYLGKNPLPDQREQQQFVGAEIEVLNSHELCGYTRIRGGWNNGDAYTVYFHMVSDKPLSARRADPHKAQEKILMHLADTLLQVKIGISYVSTQQARRNIPDNSFEAQISKVRDSWEHILSRLQVKGSERDKRMLYTGLYHTMLMPIDKTGENPKWRETPYYDDYYAIWDTYRTSTPLITLLDEQREADIVNALLNIYKREGYMPDARSGDCNGRTQGGSNAEVVIADAYVKGLKGIDYALALEAMLKDADTDPGADHEKHGRGGLAAYNRLGYIPYGTDRAGNRTVEYAYDDYCIAQVAKGLGRDDLYERFLRQSRNWRNLWRSDYEWDDVKGYIMPRDANGQWLDSVPWGHSKVFSPKIPYTPVTKVAPWYLPWWSTFFYEALSAEYSLSIPHDVAGLIEACGGAEAFRRRLDLFFERKRYNVANEPSFLTPCLYHWIGRPDLTSDRVRQIVSENYSDLPDGLPGNDDSGAMSSWLVFHQLGIYPNAGQDYYLLHAPMIDEWTLQLCNGRTLRGSVKGTGTHFLRATLNGTELSDARLTHSQLMEGGELVFHLKPQPRRQQKKARINTMESAKTKKIPATGNRPAAFNISYTLNRQHRTWPLSLAWQGDTLVVSCKEATYRISRHVAEHATTFCWDMPADGAVYQPSGTFAFVSQQAIRTLKEKGCFVYDGITWRLSERNGEEMRVRADIDQTEMRITYHRELGLYLVNDMSRNPLGIDWHIATDTAF